jgi:hypothetical protein
LSAKIKIDGVEYDFPDINTVTLDEAQILYEQSGLTLDKVGELPEGSFHPGFIKGMLYIAVHRARPELKKDELNERLGELKLTEMNEVFQDTQEDDARPPGKESGGPPARSGETGNDGSAVSPEPNPQASSGPQASPGISTSDRVTSAA